MAMPVAKAGLAPGSTVWVPDPDSIFAKATVVTVGLEHVTVTKSPEQEAAADEEAEEEDTTFAISREAVCLFDVRDEQETDLVHMSHVDAPNILNTLHARHAAGEVYANVGAQSIVLSLNPYTWRPQDADLYAVDAMHEYYQNLAFGTRALPPHIYAIASDAYRALLLHGTSQSIVTSGESGSGKTENAKQIFRFLAEISGGRSRLSGGVSVQQLLIASNPLLEAFGNASTLRNDNSSRFGKMVAVHYDTKGKISGSNTTNYLLEKTRVTGVPRGERNYHIFYQLLRGMRPNQREARGLGGVTDYALLRRTDEVAVSFDDVREWTETLDSMRSLGFSDEEAAQALDLVAAVLHVGNVEFETDPRAKHGDNQAKIVGPRHGSPIDRAAELLQFDALHTFMTHVLLHDVAAPLSVEKAVKNRDAFCAELYAALFDWIVQKINRVGDAKSAQSARFIGVLDIFGFEIFETNSFEQLCINYANEKLQRNFTQTIFDNEEGLYRAEGIAFHPVPIADNTHVLALLESKVPAGILYMIDEETRMPQGSDATLLAKMKASFDADPTNFAFYFEGVDSHNARRHPAYYTPLKKPDHFTIIHYAGEVVYDSAGLLEKSVVLLSKDLITALTNSAGLNQSWSLVSELFVAQNSRQVQRASTAQLQPIRKTPNTTARASTRKEPRREAESAKQPSLGIKFAEQLSELIESLEHTNCHYVRCIKPNNERKPLTFDTRLTLEQLRYSGVFEAVSIRKHGYPFRLVHRHFANRYRCLVAAEVTQEAALDYSTAYDQPREACEALLRLLSAKEMRATQSSTLGGIKVGKRRVFYRSIEHRILEAGREREVRRIVVAVQAAMRGVLARQARHVLAEARTALQVAFVRKKLEPLDAALELARAPQRVYNGSEWLEFLLHVPNQAEIDTLRANLVRELELEAALDKILKATDLQAVYAPLERDTALATKLNVTLGRPSQSNILRAANCICGLREGVREHDHERIRAAISETAVLGLSAKMGLWVGAAIDDLSRLEGGMNLENELEEHLTKHRSKPPTAKSAEGSAAASGGGGAAVSSGVVAVAGGESGWDHSELQSEEMQRVVDAAVAHPIESKQGLRLLSRAAVAMEVRQLVRDEEWQRLVRKLESLGLLTSDGALMGAAAATAAVATAAAQAGKELSDEVLAAREVMDKRGAVEAQLRSALDGKAPVLAVLSAKLAVEAFPLRGAEGTALLDRAAQRLEAFGARVRLRRVRAFGTMPEAPHFGSSPDDPLVGRAAAVVASAEAARKHIEEKRRLVASGGGGLAPAYKGNVTARSFIGASPYEC